jgi:integrase
LNVKGKSKDSRSIRIPDQYMSILEAWKNDGTSDYILTSVGRDSKKGERLSKTSVNTKIVNKYRDQLGIDVTPHALRRTGATIAVRQGAQVEQVRKMLGHQTERTTRIYLQDALELDDSATQYIEL